MRLYSAPAALLCLALSSLAAPTEFVSVNKYPGQVKPSSFIIKFKDNISKNARLSSNFTSRHGPGAHVTHGSWDESLFNGFAANLDENALNSLKADPDVEFIEEDGIMHTSQTLIQNDAPWGISRLSQDDPQAVKNPALNAFSYEFNSAAGSGVDIYIVDTGINIEHTEFEGRARWGATFGDNPDVDDNGHGTHCAGTAGAKRWGVAKAANLIAVKVLDSRGGGAISDIIAGLDFVLSSARSSGRPSVASMSFGGGGSTALDNVVTRLVGSSVHVAVAAGNDGEDAQNTSPARVPAVNTIGAVDINDRLASFSNFGPVVDILAPGVAVRSTWIGSPTALNTLSGTSMATPHVAGLIAYLISVEGNSPPDAMSNRLKDLAVVDAIGGNKPGTANLLARNDIPAI